MPLCPPVELAHGVSVVGRDPSACTVVLNHPSVSRVHARVDVGAAASGAPVVTVQDLQSTNRTCLHRSGSADVRERMVTDAVEVRDGDVLFFGDVKLRLTIGTSAMEPTGTVPGAGRRQPGGEHAAAAPPAPAPGPAETTGELPFGALLSGESHRLDADGRRGGR